MTTKNGNMPAMPASETQWRGDEQITSLANPGMTKREMMAMHIMTGLCSKYGVAFETDTAQDAVRMADSLLAELERTK